MKQLLLSFCFIVMALSSAANAIEREREGGMATHQPDGTILLEVEGIDNILVIKSFNTRQGGAGSANIDTTGVELFPFYQALFAHYSNMESDQVLTLPDRQIIYARGVTCIRHFNSKTWQSIDNGDLKPKGWDQYECRFLMDSRTGFTKSSPAPEPRPRMGAGN